MSIYCLKRVCFPCLLLVNAGCPPAACEDPCEANRQIVTAARGEDHIGADIHTAAQGGPTLKQSSPEGLHPMAVPWVEQGNSVRSKERQIERYVAASQGQSTTKPECLCVCVILSRKIKTLSLTIMKPVFRCQCYTLRLPFCNEPNFPTVSLLAAM